VNTDSSAVGFPATAHDGQRAERQGATQKQRYGKTAETGKSLSSGWAVLPTGNPAVMEKVKVDTEVRKLDQLRAAHLNQQHSIRLQIRSLPSEIKDRQERLERLSADVASRDGHTSDEFSMTVGNRVYSGKGAREEGGAALTQAVLSWRDDLTLQVRGAFRGFEILSRGRGTTLLAGSDEERLPELFIRGSGIYKAQLNAENSVGTMQSIEYALRGLDKAAVDERERAARAEKMLGDFQEQAGKPFEHEARLKEMLGRQAELNAALDLDKGERQIAPAAGDEEGVAGTESEGPEEAGPGAADSRPSGEARRRREYDRRVPGSRVADTDREKESPAQKGFSPMTGRKV
jgi:hypothetical protein